MTSGNQSVATVASVLALALLLPSAAALPGMESNGPSDGGGSIADPDQVLHRLTFLSVPLGDVIRFQHGQGAEGGVVELVDRVAQYVEEFDPHDDLPTQLSRAESLAVDAAYITLATLQCVVFVADPDFGHSFGVDLSGAPDRITIRLPFVMTDGDHYQGGYLLIALDFTGELECGL